MIDLCNLINNLIFERFPTAPIKLCIYIIMCIEATCRMDECINYDHDDTVTLN